jgi:hypothetical protein
MQSWKNKWIVKATPHPRYQTEKKKESIKRPIDIAKEREKPEGHDEQHSFASFTCFTASPIIHDPTLTSSCAYVRRTDLPSKSGTKDTSLDVYLLKLLFISTLDPCWSTKFILVHKVSVVYLFIEMNWATALDMTNISPEAWRKYLLVDRLEWVSHKEVVLNIRWIHNKSLKWEFTILIQVTYDFPSPNFHQSGSYHLWVLWKEVVRQLPSKEEDVKRLWLKFPFFFLFKPLTLQKRPLQISYSLCRHEVCPSEFQALHSKCLHKHNMLFHVKYYFFPQEKTEILFNYYKTFP